jgi:hypothetical protein
MGENPAQKRSRACTCCEKCGCSGAGGRDSPPADVLTRVMQATMTKAAIASVIFALLVSPALGQGIYYAAPSGVDNPTCSQAQPCTPRGAFIACSHDTPTADMCQIQLADGEYYDPEINIYYYRAASYLGNCANPSSVRLIGTLRNTTLIWVQDHAIGVFGCMRLEGFTGGVTGIAGRQHVIVDYSNIVFGNMPGGSHVTMNEFSIASCLGQVKIAGDALVHASAFSNSKINLGCEMNLNGVFNIDFFVNTAAWSVINANSARFTGSFFVKSIAACNSDGLALVYRTQPFPGLPEPGNC